jgi:hypothetical protein
VIFDVTGDLFTHGRQLKQLNAGGAKGPDFWCAFEAGEVKVIGDEPANT